MKKLIPAIAAAALGIVSLAASPARADEHHEFRGHVPGPVAPARAMSVPPATPLPAHPRPRARGPPLSFTPPRRGAPPPLGDGEGGGGAPPLRARALGGGARPRAPDA